VKGVILNRGGVCDSVNETHDTKRSAGMAAAKDVKEDGTHRQMQVPKEEYCGVATGPVNWVNQAGEEVRGCAPRQNKTITEG
jgi:hypothetical protein